MTSFDLTTFEPSPPFQGGVLLPDGRPGFLVMGRFVVWCPVTGTWEARVSPDDHEPISANGPGLPKGLHSQRCGQDDVLKPIQGE